MIWVDIYNICPNNETGPVATVLKISSEISMSDSTNYLLFHTDQRKCQTQG